MNTDQLRFEALNKRQILEAYEESAFDLMGEVYGKRKKPAQNEGEFAK